MCFWECIRKKKRHGLVIKGVRLTGNIFGAYSRRQYCLRQDWDKHMVKWCVCRSSFRAHILSLYRYWILLSKSYARCVFLEYGWTRITRYVCIKSTLHITLWFSRREMFALHALDSSAGRMASTFRSFFSFLFCARSNGRADF